MTTRLRQRMAGALTYVSRNPSAVSCVPCTWMSAAATRLPASAEASPMARPGRPAAPVITETYRIKKNASNVPLSCAAGLPRLPKQERSRLPGAGSTH